MKLTLFVLVSLALSVGAQTTKEFQFQEKLVPADIAASDFYGIQSATYDEYAISSTFLSDANALANSGSVYVYKRNEETLLLEEIQTLTASDAEAEDRFGFGIDICENYIVVAANVADAVYFYKKNGAGTFDEIDIKFVSDPVSVACDGEDFVASTSSAVYYFSYNSASGLVDQNGFLVDPSSVQSSNFGYKLRIRNGLLFVSAYNYDDPNSGSTIFDKGAVHVYSKSGSSWSFEDTLLGSDTAISDGFGWTLDFANDVLVVGRISDGGRVYVFSRDNGTGDWTEETIITAVAADCVSINNDYFIIGDNSANGRVRVYSATSPFAQIDNYDMGDFLLTSGDNIGDSCAISSLNFWVAGGSRSSDNGVSGGSLMYFHQTPHAWGAFVDPSTTFDDNYLCDHDWVYRETAGAQDVEPDSDGCLSIAAYQPFFKDGGPPDWDYNETSALATLPVGYALNASRWCSYRKRRCQGTSSVYRPDTESSDPQCTTGEIKRSWGFCTTTILETSGPATTSTPSVSPTVLTDAPTVTTDAPTPATASPTVSTDSPTVATDAPTGSTDSPTVATDAPTGSTDAPTPATASPTVATDAPTATTDAPTASTEAPTSQPTGSPPTQRQCGCPSRRLV